MGIKQSLSFHILVIIISVILAIPLLFLVGLSFKPDVSGYTLHFLYTRGASYFHTSVLLVFLSVSGTVLIGTGMAWIMSRYRFPGHKIFSWLLILPLGAPAYVIAYAYAEITSSSGGLQTGLQTVFGDWGDGISHFIPEVYGLFGAGFVFSLALYPYLYLLARAAFSERGADVFEAARTLGASPQKAFFTIALPLARPALVAGSALVAMEVLSDYGVTSYLGAPTFSVGIFRAWFGAGDIISAARLSLLLLLLTGLAFTFERVQKGRKDKRILVNSLRVHRTILLSGLKGWLMSFLVSLPLIFSLGIPVIHFIILSLDSSFSDRLGSALLNSLFLAVLAAGPAALLGLICASILRSNVFISRFSVRLISLGYALPGAVAALAVLIGFGLLKRNLGIEISSGLSFLLSLITLVFAYQMRFISAAIHPAEAALAKADPLLETTARTLGAKTWRLLTQIYIPLASKGLSIGFILVFIEVLKELPATMILSPANFETLAILAHTYASDERLHQAALPSLILILAGSTPLIIIIHLSRWFGKKKETS